MKKFATNVCLLAAAVLITIFSVNQFSFARELSKGVFFPTKGVVSTNISRPVAPSDRQISKTPRDEKVKEKQSKIEAGSGAMPKPQPVVQKPKGAILEYPPANVTKDVYRSGPATIKQVALTFDDGPDLVYTPAILDILRQENVKATFFVIGQRAEHYPEIIRRINQEGHALGNHTWSHINLAKATSEAVRSQILKTSSLLDSIVGYTPTLVRPPFGSTNGIANTEINDIGCRVVTWSVDTRDWEGVNTDKMMDYIHRQLRPGGIILMHSSGGKGGKLDNTIKALPVIIASLKEQGYQFVSVQELLGFGI